MYLHKKDYEIRYTDVDANDKLKLSSLLSVLQESACLSADELHFGYDDITPLNIAFIISNWYIHLDKPVHLGQKLTIETWPIKPKRLIVFRDFRIYADDELVGVATSRWCLVDINSFKLLSTENIFANDEREYNDFRSVDWDEWKIQSIESSNCSYSKNISYSDYDHYRHVNNTKYADMAMDALTDLERENIKGIRISYNKQCKMGEKLDFYKGLSEDGSLTVEGKVGEELRVQFNFIYGD